MKRGTFVSTNFPATRKKIIYSKIILNKKRQMKFIICFGKWFVIIFLVCF